MGADMIVERRLIHQRRGLTTCMSTEGLRGGQGTAPRVPGQIQNEETPAVLQKVVVMWEADRKERVKRIWGDQSPGLRSPGRGKHSSPPTSFSTYFLQRLDIYLPFCDVYKERLQNWKFQV